jgi:hypothetical protein
MLSDSARKTYIRFVIGAVRCRCIALRVSRTGSAMQTPHEFAVAIHNIRNEIKPADASFGEAA